MPGEAAVEGVCGWPGTWLKPVQLEAGQNHPSAGTQAPRRVTVASAAAVVSAAVLSQLADIAASWAQVAAGTCLLLLLMMMTIHTHRPCSRQVVYKTKSIIVRCESQQCRAC